MSIAVTVNISYQFKKIIMYLSNFEILVNKHLSAIKFPTSPKNLYEPIEYLISIGGKRVRPIASLITFSLFKEINADIINASLAIETFHNFTLAHDDIMDDSKYRRGKETINKKWNNNIAILSGDALLIKSYQFLNKISSEKKDDIINFFNEIALKVCEGQQMDMDFETKNHVTIDDYLLMIKLKTAVLFAASLKIAAILSGATNKDIDFLYNFGLNIGTAFQLRDDYLDTFGKSDSFGKVIGSDIKSKKKTILFINAMQKSNEEDRIFLEKTYSEKSIVNNEEVQLVTQIFKKYGVDKYCNQLSQNYYELASENITKVSVSYGKLKNYSDLLFKRKN